MLYVSSKDNTNTYTAHRALFEQCASDGGMFMPFKLPVFTAEDIQQMSSNSIGSNIAQILNLFFSSRMTGWDVEFCCGRYFASICAQPNKVLVAELWHNTNASYAYIERALYQKLCGDDAPEQITPWAQIAIRIAVFFAVFALIDRNEDAAQLDVAVDNDGFVAPIAAWYARKMGLPIGMILCGSYNDASVWDLVHRGEVNTAALQYRAGFMQLICAELGQDEALRFVGACQNRRVFRLNEEQILQLSERFFVAVISFERIAGTVNSFYRSHGYALDSAAAAGFGALQDYRARVGENRTTLMFSLINPAKEAAGNSKRG